MKPTTANKITDDVATSCVDNRKIRPQAMTIKTASKSTKAAGMAFCKTVLIKRPRMRCLLGSKANINPGIPIVNALIKETCDACKDR